MSGSVHVLRLTGGEVLLVSPEARRQVAYLLRLGVRVASGRDGIPAPPLTTALLGAFDAGSAAEPAEVPLSVDLPVSVENDLIDTKEIAAMLGTSTRNARKRCATGSFATSIFVAGRWLADRGEIAQVSVDRCSA